MTQEEQTRKRLDFRKKRVKILKKIIGLTLGILLITPMVLCFILLNRVRDLNANVKALQESVAALEENLLIPEQVSEESLQSETAETTIEQASVAGSRGSEIADLSVPVFGNTKEKEGITADSVACVEDGADGTAKRIYLTFDDGPSIYTDEILDILKEYDVKATFFVLVKDQESLSDCYSRIVEEGHSIGIHSATHVMHTIYVSPQTLLEDISTARQFIYDKTGVWTNLYRFPGGSSNSFIKKNLDTYLTAVTDAGYVYFDWNIDSKDADGEKLTKTQVYRNVVDCLSKHDTCMILMHDAQSKHSTVEALPEIIEAILEMDNTVILPITEETEPIQHRSVDS